MLENNRFRFCICLAQHNHNKYLGMRIIYPLENNDNKLLHIELNVLYIHYLLSLEALWKQQQQYPLSCWHNHNINWLTISICLCEEAYDRSLCHLHVYAHTNTNAIITCTKGLAINVLCIYIKFYLDLYTKKSHVATLLKQTYVYRAIQKQINRKHFLSFFGTMKKKYIV